MVLHFTTTISMLVTCNQRSREHRSMQR